MKTAWKYVLAVLALWPSLAFAGTIYDHPTPDWRASE